MSADIFYLLLLALATLVIQLVGLPIVIWLFGKDKLLPEWWAWGRLTGWLAIGLPIWLLSHLHLPLNTTVGFWLVISILMIWIYGWRRTASLKLLRNFVRQYPREIIYQEGLFLIGFIGLGIIRTYQPDILDLEKFMNAGLMQTYLRSPFLPAIDMWLSGMTINYYSFGHFLGSLMLRFWNLPVEIGFNVLPGWMLGLVLLESSALTQSLLRKFIPGNKHFSWPLVLAGLVSGILISFGGNSHPVWYLFTNGNWQGYWYPDAVRLIYHAIHEIPAYSFIVSDLHAHFWSMVVVLFTIFAISRWFHTLLDIKQHHWRQLWRHQLLMQHTFIVGVLLAVLGMTNTWDMLIYGALLILLGIVTLLIKRPTLKKLVVSAVQIAVIAGAIFLSWFWYFDSITQGIFFVTEQSPVWQLLVLWTGHVVISILVVWFVSRLMRKHSNLLFTGWLVISLAILAWLCLLLPEFIYFKDIYPTYPRANTMFKFTYQAFIILSVLGGWLAGFALQAKGVVKKLIGSLVIVFMILVSSYAVYGYRSYYNQFEQRTSLAGLQWLKLDNPPAYWAINWLRDHTDGRPVLLEAVGDSYTTYGRASVFSGLPTLMGWRAHEWLWRGGYAIPKQRTADAAWIYEHPLDAKTAQLLDRYSVKYILISDLEREQYNLVLADLLTLGEIVFREGNVIILER